MYREEAPERVAARVEAIANEMNALDSELGSWAKRVPDGTPAPPQVVALMQRREQAMAELRSLTQLGAAVAAERPGVIGRLFGRLRSR